MRPSFRYRVSVAVVAVLALAAVAPAQTSGSLTRFDSAADWGKFPKLFQPFRVHTGRTVDVRPDGVVLAAPAVKNAGPFGMQAERTLVGDFQIDVKYDLVEFPHHPLDAGYGLVVGMSLDAGPKFGSVKTGRSVYTKRGPSYHAQRSFPVGGDKPYHASVHMVTLAEQGRLGIRRVGTEAIILAADTPDGELQEWTRYPFTDKPVRVISLYADTGGAAEGVKARLYDLQLRTGLELPPAPKAFVNREVVTIARLPPEAAALAQASAADTAEPVPTSPDAPGAEPTAPPPVRGGWWLPVATFAAGIVVGLTAGRLRRGPVAAPPEPRPTAPKPAAPRPPVTTAKPAADKPRSPAV